MITETCCCGATFRTDESFTGFAERAAAAFRANHRHEVPQPAANDGGAGMSAEDRCLDLSMFVTRKVTDESCNEGFDCPVRGHFHV